MSDCGPLSCALIERVNKGRKPPKRGMAGRETRIPKGLVPHRRSGIHRGFSYIAHNRRNVRFKGLWRDTHHPIPEPRTQRLTGRNTGRFRWGRCHYPRTVLRGSETLRGRVSERHTLPLLGLDRVCSQRTQRAFGTAMRMMRVAVPRRRGPAGLRDPVAVSLTALMGFAVLLSRFVGTQKIERLFFSYSGAFFEPLFASIHARNLSFGTTIRLPILSAGKPSLCASS